MRVGWGQRPGKLWRRVRLTDVSVVSVVTREGEGAAWVNRRLNLSAWVAPQLYDEAKGTTFAARDHMGKIPLYIGYGKDGSKWFASEMKVPTAPLRRPHVPHACTGGRCRQRTRPRCTDGGAARQFGSHAPEALMSKPYRHGTRRRPVGTQSTAGATPGHSGWCETKTARPSCTERRVKPPGILPVQVSPSAAGRG
jgi:hypothetical protein